MNCLKIGWNYITNINHQAFPVLQQYAKPANQNRCWSFQRTKMMKLTALLCYNDGISAWEVLTRDFRLILF